MDYCCAVENCQRLFVCLLASQLASRLLCKQASACCSLVTCSLLLHPFVIYLYFLGHTHFVFVFFCSIQYGCSPAPAQGSNQLDQARESLIFEVPLGQEFIRKTAA